MSDKAPDFITVRETPPEGDEICDFCSKPHPVWAYPCRNHTHTEMGMLVKESGQINTFEIEGISDGAWAACQVCYLLIQRGDRERLAKHSAKRLLKSIDPELARAWSLKDATEHIRRIHDSFWRNREGNPERISK